MTESLTAPEEHFSWKQFLTKKRYLPKWFVAFMKWLFFGIVALCILWAGGRYFFGTQVDTLQLARQGGEDLSLAPQSLTDHSTAPALSSFQAYGYAFQLPWKDARELNKFGTESSTTILAAGAGMTISNPYTKTSVQGMLRKMPQYSGTLFRPGKFPTDYALLRAELYSSPKDIRYFVLPQNATRICTLVQLKWFELSMTEAQTVETIDMPFFHGFEYRGKREIILKRFDSTDRLLEIHFFPRQTPIPQSEINTFIASLRPADEGKHD